MKLLIRTIARLIVGLIVALVTTWMSVALVGALRPLEWGFKGTFQLVALLVSLAYATGALLIICGGLISGTRGRLAMRVFVLLGVLAPLIHFVFELQGLVDLLDHVPWAVTPCVAGTVSALIVFGASARWHRRSSSAA
jgi:hypothetical protein